MSNIKMISAGSDMLDSTPLFIMLAFSLYSNNINSTINVI